MFLKYTRIALISEKYVIDISLKDGARGGLWLRQQAPCSSNRADLFCNFNMAYTPCHRQSGIKTTTIITTVPADFKQA